MMIRRPWLIKVAGFVASWASRLWARSLRYRYRSLGPDVQPNRPGLCGRYIYVVWHENMLFPIWFFGRRDMRPLISQSSDGQLIHEVCRNLGFRPVRGSTTRGSLKAVRQILRVGSKAHLLITPDGPRGPRREVQAGIVYLASRTGMPIVPMGIGFERPWRFRSWDRFAVPRPWGLATCVTGAPLTIPPNATKEQREHYRRLVEQEMHHLSARAERWAETGRWLPLATATSSAQNGQPATKNHELLKAS